MANLGGTINVDDLPDNESNFDIMPPHDCLVHIVESDYKQNSKGTGEIMPLTFEILDGQFANRKVWKNINMVMFEAGTNDKATTAQKIGQGEFKEILQAIGKLSVSDSSELHNIPMRASIYVEPGSGQYAAKNGVRNFKPESAAFTPPTQAPAAAKPAASGGGGAPWKQKAA